MVEKGIVAEEPSRRDMPDYTTSHLRNNEIKTCASSMYPVCMLLHGHSSSRALLARVIDISAGSRRALPFRKIWKGLESSVSMLPSLECHKLGTKVWPSLFSSSHLECPKQMTTA